MSLYINLKKEKVEASYKTIYLKNDLIEKINQIASDNNTSFNNVIVSMLTYCVNDNIETNKKA